MTTFLVEIYQLINEPVAFGLVNQLISKVTLQVHHFIHWSFNFRYLKHLGCESLCFVHLRFEHFYFIRLDLVLLFCMHLGY
jgi:hypothetical protein